METSKCQLKKQGLAPGSCLVNVDGKHQHACQATLKYEQGNIYRLITSVHLSRPENYLSIYHNPVVISLAENVTPGISVKYRMGPGTHQRTS